jgi:hypothetical protein
MSAKPKQTFMSYMIRMAVAGIILSGAAYYATRPEPGQNIPEAPSNFTDLYILARDLDTMSYAHELDLDQDGKLSQADISLFAWKLTTLRKADNSAPSASAGSKQVTMDIYANTQNASLAAWELELAYDNSRFAISRIHTDGHNSEFDPLYYDANGFQSGILRIGGYDLLKPGRKGQIKLARVIFTSTDDRADKLGYRLISACDRWGQPTRPIIQLIEIEQD